jgi:thioredoxin reductase
MPIALHLDDGRRVKASTIVVATGARYRRLLFHRCGAGNGLAQRQRSCLGRQEHFILTGSDVPRDTRRSNNGSGRPLPLETSVRNVFASGDVRSGSVKRVGAAIGEGAVVGAELHAALTNGAAVAPRAATK